MVKRNILKKNSRRKPQLKKIQLDQLLKQIVLIAAVTIVVGSLGGAGYYLSRTVNQFLQKPIASIEIEGEFSYLTKAEISKLIFAEIEKSFINE